MFKQSPIARTLLHLANLLVIAFFLLPLFAVAIGSIQSERSLQADTRAVFPREVTLDNGDWSAALGFGQAYGDFTVPGLSRTGWFAGAGIDQNGVFLQTCAEVASGHGRTKDHAGEERRRASA